MTWRTHFLGGVASVWLLQPFALGAMAGSGDLQSFGVLAACAGFGALLPDVDASESKLKHLSISKGVEPFALPSLLFHRLLGHRGLTHSLLGWAVVAVVLGLPIGFFLGWLPALALLLGYGSHLLLDSMTKHGIPWLYPHKKRFHFLPSALLVSTGSNAEDAVFALLVLSILPLLLIDLNPTR